MHRRVNESNLRRFAGAAVLALVLAGLAGCGVENSNPFAPIVETSSQGTLATVARNSKHNHNHTNGNGSPKTQTPSGPSMSGGGTSGTFFNPGEGEPNGPFVTE